MRLIHTPVHRSVEYEDTLQKLGGTGAVMFTTLREALTFCAVLGYKERRRKPLDAKTEDIAGAQYHLNDAVDMVFALALADAKKSDILRPDRERECVQIYEEYANGGLEIVQSWIERYANVNIEDAVWRGLKAIGVGPPQSDDAAPGAVAPVI
tara:strand:- start:10 stop:468 length:459 start_codon:yes stop_codon:yes gene_type:complete